MYTMYIYIYIYIYVYTHIYIYIYIWTPGGTPLQLETRHSWAPIKPPRDKHKCNLGQR